ncbi:endoglucanase [Caulobacter sp. CCNWLY153]|uniref:endoglucanase n=1 Tax=unclassified Caulobacter TaxID=2648921 RepID=UPI002FF015BF
MNLRGALKASVAAICIASVVAPTVLAAAPAAAQAARPAANQGDLVVRVAQAPDFSRLEFRWSGRVPVMKMRREGQQAILRFGRDANPNLASLRIAPPRWVKTVEARHVGGALELVLTLTDDADLRVGRADGIDFVNVFAKPPQAGAPAAPTPAPVPRDPRRPNPAPASGVVAVTYNKTDGQTQFVTTWAAPAAAAVFKRGEAVWVVFDAPVRLDLGRTPQTGPSHTKIQVFRGADYSALRIVAKPGVPVYAEGQGNNWTVALGAGLQREPDPVKVARDEAATPASLSANLAGAARPVWVSDPAVGDRIGVVPALAPSKGLASRREYVEMALLPSAQGLAVEAFASDVQILTEGDIVRIGRPKGLVLSPASVGGAAAEVVTGAPQPAAMPAVIDLENWPKTGSGGFLARYNALQAAIAAVDPADRQGDIAARMALARFLVGSGLSYEAIGVLNAAARKQQALLGDGEFRGLRGAAKAMAGRWAEAEADFSSPVLSDDPSSALWRGYVAYKQGQWVDARNKFAAGGQAMNLFPAVWQARFLGAQADSAAATGDGIGAERLVSQALKLPKLPIVDQLELRLVQAKAFELQGRKDKALKMFQAIGKAPNDRIATPAVLHATQIRLEKNQISPAEAARTLDQLRFRWRGDGVELDVVRALGKLYIDQGRYREALEVLRSASKVLPDLPQAVALQNDLYGAFRTLFLDGLADGMQPIQAVGLFYDYQDLTPIGADGDQMVRNLVRRLVDVDLLDEAAKLLKYQVDNRLNGVPKAQVATDLAWIYLMDRKPEDALAAINGTRTTILPPVLNAERRLATARSLMTLGRYDDALEVIEGDKGKDAQDIRGDIAWKQRNWALAGKLYEAALGDRFKNAAGLSPSDEAKLMRAAVAYSLSDDDASLGRLRTRYTNLIGTGRNPEGLRVALAGVDGVASSSDFGRVTAENEVFNGWVAKMKDRFRAAATPKV